MSTNHVVVLSSEDLNRVLVVHNDCTILGNIQQLDDDGSKVVILGTVGDMEHINVYSHEWNAFVELIKKIDEMVKDTS